MPSPDNSAAPQPGATARLERVVDTSVTASHLPGLGVFSTPAMISMLELACHEAVRSTLLVE